MVVKSPVRPPSFALWVARLLTLLARRAKLTTFQINQTQNKPRVPFVWARNNQAQLIMKNPNSLLTRLATALGIVTSITTLHAGGIYSFSWHSGVASLAATSISPLIAPNNDDTVGPSPNEVFVTQKNYIAVGPVDIVFSVTNSGGVSEYLFKEGVFNNTGLNWSGYHIELGFGFDAGFVKSLPGDGLDFDAPDYNSPFNFAPSPGFFFPTVSVTEDDVIAGGGVMPYLAFAGNFRFTVDVPDGITEFTVRQSPIPLVVPEPSSLILSAFSAAGLVMMGKRRTLKTHAAGV